MGKRYTTEHTATCENCGDSFHAKYSTTKYCPKRRCKNPVMREIDRKRKARGQHTEQRESPEGQRDKAAARRIKRMVTAPKAVFTISQLQHQRGMGKFADMINRILGNG